MKDQLQHLLHVIDEQPWTTIQVMPLSVGDHPQLGGSTTAFRFAGGAVDIVHQATFIGGGVYVDEEDETQECFRAYDRLRASALSPQPSRDFIAKCLREFG
jgi:hypothetical protein